MCKSHDVLRSNIERIREKIRRRQYGHSAYAMNEMAKDGLDIVDMESVVLNGQIRGHLMYGYSCTYCDGTVQPRVVEREAFKHKNGFVILEDIVVGVCDICGNRYYTADILHTVHDIATGKRAPTRTEKIPVAH